MIKNVFNKLKEKVVAFTTNPITTEDDFEELRRKANEEYEEFERKRKDVYEKIKEELRKEKEKLERLQSETKDKQSPSDRWKTEVQDQVNRFSDIFHEKITVRSKGTKCTILINGAEVYEFTNMTPMFVASVFIDGIFMSRVVNRRNQNKYNNESPKRSVNTSSYENHRKDFAKKSLGHHTSEDILELQRQAFIKGLESK